MDDADAARIIDDDLDGEGADYPQFHPSAAGILHKVFTTYIAPYRVHLGNNNTFLFIDGDSYGMQPTPHLIDLDAQAKLSNVRPACQDPEGEKVVQDALAIIEIKMICYDGFPENLEMLIFIRRDSPTKTSRTNTYISWIKTRLIIKHARFKTSAGLGLGGHVVRSWHEHAGARQGDIPLTVMYVFIIPPQALQAPDPALHDEVISRPNDFHANIYMCDGVIVFPHIPGPTLALTSAAAYALAALAALAEYSTGAHINAKFLQTMHGNTYKKHALALDHCADCGWQAHVKALQCRNVSLAFRAFIGFVCRSSNDEDGGIITLPIRFDVMEK
ncbi:hypothetical protein BOTBODRAFT_181247 [Botryobasidium botryosum FD-172 SS1]|uniref:Uncharacterized protein n=1 Tax=Botryobasidium botryosum (strain FD-172 SS1) TaxID=930990 RepID=A0A067LWU6_BOTB1|nr:hypothetical protein BOTBODRAFT_181247 [Botryobasidium botryosum FD-172 SS1]